MKLNAWFAALALLPSLAFAQTDPLDLRDVMQARNYAMGGAYRALGLGTEVVEGNPAALAVIPRYQMELGGAWDFKGKAAFASVSVLDSQSSPVAAGVSYHLLSFGQGLDRKTAHVNTLALATPIIADALYIGASARHLLLAGAGTGNAITSDAGVLVRLFGALSLSATAHNWIDTGHRELAPYYSFSAGFLGRSFALAFDAKLDNQTRAVSSPWAFGGGGEYVMFGALPVRGGYSWDGLTGDQFVSGGFGFLTDRGALDLAYRHQLGGEGGRVVALSFRMQM